MKRVHSKKIAAISPHVIESASAKVSDRYFADKIARRKAANESKEQQAGSKPNIVTR